MRFVICPHCKRVKFLDKEKSPIWVKLLPEESVVFDLIVASDYLLLIIGGYEEIHESCEECCLTELN